MTKVRQIKQSYKHQIHISECNTYRINENELCNINEIIHIKERKYPKFDSKEYRGYQSYRRNNIKRIMSSYNSSKTQSKKGKLTKEQFVMLYMDSIRKKLNKNNINNTSSKKVLDYEK
jgi:outer membrane protein assembly factor BamA